MAHNLFGERFIETSGNGRARAWHRLGQTFDPSKEPLTAQAALAKAGMTYRMKKFPLSVDMTATRRREDGTIERSQREKHLLVPDQFGIVREPVTEDPQERLLGVVGRSYTLLQNTDLAKMIDQMGQGKWNVETVGALGQGETIFFALASGSWDIKGDEIEDYIVVTDQRDGKGGITVADTRVRVVCQNTLSWGLQAAASKVSLSHSLAVAEETRELLAIFSKMKEIQSEGRKNLEALTEIAVTDETAKALIEAVYPMPQVPAKVKLALSVDGAVETPNLLKGKEAWEKQCDATLGWRDKTFDLFERFNDEHSRFARTGYAAYNAVTEHEDHYKNGRSDRTRAEGAVFGDRAMTKSRSFELIRELSAL